MNAARLFSGRPALVFGMALGVLFGGAVTAGAVPGLDTGPPTTVAPRATRAAPAPTAAAAPVGSADMPATVVAPGQPSGPTTAVAGRLAGSAATAADEDPARVTVISSLLDVFATGSAAGPGVLNGLASTVIYLVDLPDPGSELQAGVASAVTETNAQIAERGGAGVEAFRDGVAGGACANGPLNQVIGAIADQFDVFASDFGEAIEPFDLTAAESAKLLRGLQEQEQGC